jgi:hypothetical protein
MDTGTSMRSHFAILDASRASWFGGGMVDIEGSGGMALGAGGMAGCLDVEGI